MRHSPYTVALFGPLGRLGHAVASTLLEDARFSLSFPVTSASSSSVGKPLFAAKENSPLLIGGIENLTVQPDFFVDCALAEATLPIARKAAEWRKPLLVASTGHSAAQKEELEALSQKTPILIAPNLSRGIALLLALLPSLGIPARATLEETHRAGKKDLPSGTALLIERELHALFQGEELLDPIVSHRIDGKPAEHRVVFEFPGEEIEISHRATDRRAYALGAIEALLFLADKPPGLYSMKEVFLPLRQGAPL